MNVKGFYYDWCIRVIPETVDLIEHYLDLKNESHAPVHNFIQRAIEENKDCYFTSDHNYAYLNKGTELPNYRKLTGIEFSYYILESLKNCTMAQYSGTKMGFLEQDYGKWFRVKDNPEYRNAYYSIVKRKFNYYEEKEVKYEFEEGSPIYNLIKDLNVLNTWCEELPKQKELRFGNHTVILEYDIRIIHIPNGRGDMFNVPFDHVLKLYKYIQNMPQVAGYDLKFNPYSDISFGCINGKWHQFSAIVQSIRKEDK